MGWGTGLGRLNRVLGIYKIRFFFLALGMVLLNIFMHFHYDNSFIGFFLIRKIICVHCTDVAVPFPLPRTFLISDIIYTVYYLLSSGLLRSHVVREAFSN